MPRSTRFTKAPKGRRSGAATNGLLYPLDMAYERAGLAKPAARHIAAEDLPFPYRSLLAHTNTMTLALEQHFGGRLGLRTLSTFQSGAWYLRRVLLVQEESGRPVEMGALRITLTPFGPRVRARILRADAPLGRVLRDAGVAFESRPRAFLAVTPNPEMMGVFWMPEPLTLYGRQTEVMLEGRKIGDIVEILPRV
jgi:chorismate-pyruvate lyase